MPDAPGVLIVLSVQGPQVGLAEFLIEGMERKLIISKSVNIENLKIAALDFNVVHMMA